MADSSVEAFFKGLNEFPNLQESLGCPYDIIKETSKKFCSIDDRPCHLMISFFGPYCDRHGSSANMDELAGKKCWEDFFLYTQILSFDDRKKIFKEQVRIGDINHDAKRWDSLLYHLKKAAEIAWGNKIEK